MLALRLSGEAERRLQALTERTGRTKTFYACAAIDAYLDDIEDFYLAEERNKQILAEDAIPLNALKAKLGLDD